MANLPPGESERLRHFRELIREMYYGFQAGLPDCEPPMIFSLATFEDGTTEDSKYPNLMSAEERVPYGV